MYGALYPKILLRLELQPPPFSFTGDTTDPIYEAAW